MSGKSMRCDRCGAYMRHEERTPYNGYTLHPECVPEPTEPTEQEQER